MSSESEQSDREERPASRAKDFVADEAEESDAEESDSGKPKRTRKVLSDSDEEEEEKTKAEPNEYQPDGFVVNDEEADKSDEEVRKRKRKSVRIDKEVDEDDIALIEDNLGVKIRPEKKKLMRLKKKVTGSDEEADDKPTTRDELEKQLFQADDYYSDTGGNEEEDERSYQRKGHGSQGRRDRARSPQSGSDSDTFVVDEAGRAIRDNDVGNGGGLSLEEAHMEAESIFGTGLDMLQSMSRRGARSGDDSDEDEDEESEDQEVDSEEDDDGYGASQRATRVRRQRPAPVEETLEDRLKGYREAYEPAVLAGSYVGEQDEVIRRTDRAERLALRDIKPRPNDDFEVEGKFVYEQAFTKRQYSEALVPLVQEKITAVLSIMQKEDVEVPFISMYRKESYLPELTVQDLWTIYDWDERYTTIGRDRERLRRLLEDIPEVGDRKDSLEGLIEKARTSEEINDTRNYIVHLFAARIAEKEKRPAPRDLYSSYAEMGSVQALRATFGLTPDELAEAININYSSVAIPDPMNDPLTEANDKMGITDTTAENVLNATRYVLSKDISLNPDIRRMVRDIFQRNVTVSTNPTVAGKREIDAFHIYADVKCLKEKPASFFGMNLQPNFEDRDQFLLIAKAEREKLLEVKFNMPEEILQRDVLREMEQLYLSSSTSETAQQWNEQRTLVLREAVAMMLPSLQQELERKLKREADEAVANKTSALLEDIIGMAPSIPTAVTENDDEDDDAYRIMSIVSGDPTLCAVISRRGEVVDVMQLNNMRANKDSTDKLRDLDSLRKFISKHRPATIGIGAGNLDARRLAQDIRLKNLNSYSEGEARVLFVDERASLLYASSPQAAQAFPEYSVMLRQAVSLARFVQDPLSEVSKLVEKDVIMGLRLYYLQDAIDRELLKSRFYRAFINVTAKVGVNINRLLATGFASSLLQFIAGLGPRKAAMLVAALNRKGGRLVSRRDLVERKLMGKNVFVNSSAFLRITPDMNDHNILDNTRIHPEMYSIAVKMCCDALDTPNLDERGADIAVRSVIESKQDVLDDIDLDGFSDQLEARGSGKKRLTLNDIKSELQGPFHELRKVYEEPSTQTLFEWMTGETALSLQVGQLVSGKVISINDKETVASVRLDNGLIGTLLVKDVSDTRVDKISDRLEVGMPIHARVEELRNADMERFGVLLVSKSSVLRDENHDRERMRLERTDRYNEIDRFFDVEGTRTDKPKRAFIHRIIQHPLFFNFNLRAAIEKLKDEEPGEFVIRPSSKGTDHLTITWKMWRDVYVHIDIKEKDKQNQIGIGRKLVINRRKFDDLDEILASYLDGVIRYSRAVTRFRVFRDNTDEEVQEFLKRDKAAEPKKIPYYINISKKHPGYFNLWYMATSKPRKEPLSISPEGFRFRNRDFGSLEKMIAWFKVHYKEAIPQPVARPEVDSSEDERRKKEAADRRAREPVTGGGDAATLFVGGLPRSQWDERELKQHFMSVGSRVASCRVVKDRDTGDYKGIAFVEMASVEEAENVRNKLDGSRFLNGSLRIDFSQRARQAPTQDSQGGYGGGFGGSQSRDWDAPPTTERTSSGGWGTAPLSQPTYSSSTQPSAGGWNSAPVVPQQASTGGWAASSWSAQPASQIIPSQQQPATSGWSAAPPSQSSQGWSSQPSQQAPPPSDAGWPSQPPPPSQGGQGGWGSSQPPSQSQGGSGW